MTKDQSKTVYDVKGPMDAARSCKVAHLCSLAKAGIKWEEEFKAMRERKEAVEKDLSGLKAQWDKAAKPEDKLDVLTRLEESIRIAEVERDFGLEQQKVMSLQALIAARDEKVNDLQAELAEKRSLYDADPILRQVEMRIKAVNKDLAAKETELALKESNIQALDDHARYLTSKVDSDRKIWQEIFERVNEKRKELQKLERQAGRLALLADKPKNSKPGPKKTRNPFKRLWAKIRREES